MGSLHLRGVQFNKPPLNVILDFVFLIKPFSFPISNAPYLVPVSSNHSGNMKKYNVFVPKGGCIKSGLERPEFLFLEKD